MRNHYLIINKWALTMDSFRYTSQRQYIAERDDGSLQPVVYSVLPLIMLVTGATFLTLFALAFLVMAPGSIDMTTTPVMVFIAFVLAGIGGGLSFSDYRLMYAVGPKSFDGKRKFWSEEKEERTMLAQRGDNIGADNQ